MNATDPSPEGRSILPESNQETSAIGISSDQNKTNRKQRNGISKHKGFVVEFLEKPTVNRQKTEKFGREHDERSRGSFWAFSRSLGKQGKQEFDQGFLEKPFQEKAKKTLTWSTGQPGPDP